MQFKDIGKLFEGDEWKVIYNGGGLKSANFKTASSISDMQNVTADMFNQQFRINSDGMSKWNKAQIEAKANAIGLTDSLKNEVLAMASDATITDKMRTGKLTWAKAIAESGDGISDVADALVNSGKISDEWIEKIGKANKNNLRQTLMDCMQATDGLGNSIIELSEAGTSSTGFFSSLGNSAKGFLAYLKSMLPAIIAIGTAIAAWKIFEYSQTGFTRATEKMNTSVSEYQENAQELDSLNSKLDETKDRIAELQSLQSKGVITFDEEVELEKLQAENDELERKITLQKDLVKIKQEASASATEKAANSEQSFYEYNKEKYGFWGGLLHTATGYLDPQEGINDGRSTAEQWQWQNNGDTTISNQLKNNLNVLEQYQDELQKYEEEHYKEKGTDAVETMLDALKAYGYVEPLKDIKYSTENVKEYKNALQGLEDVYDSMENGDSKKRLKKLLKGYNLGGVHIDGFEEELEKYQNDMDNLPEEKIIRIKLEYDLSSIQQQIDQLQAVANEGGDSQTWAELNAKCKITLYSI